MKTIQTEIPENLYKDALALAKEGWFRDKKEVFSEAIRRFLETHQPHLAEGCRVKVRRQRSHQEVVPRSLMQGRRETAAVKRFAKTAAYRTGCRL